MIAATHLSADAKATIAAHAALLRAERNAWRVERHLSALLAAAARRRARPAQEPAHAQR